MRRAIPFLIFAAVSTALVTGSYLVLQRFLEDRQSAISTPRRESLSASTHRQPGTGEKNSQGKNVQRPAGLPGQTAADAGQAAIQRQLKTLQEINNINEMNRRLMEQQRRMQNQR